MYNTLKIVQSDQIKDLSETLHENVKEKTLFLDEDNNFNILDIMQKRYQYGKFIPHFIGNVEPEIQEFAQLTGPSDIISITKNQFIFIKIDENNNITDVKNITRRTGHRKQIVMLFLNKSLVTTSYIQNRRPLQETINDSFKVARQTIKLHCDMNDFTLHPSMDNLNSFCWSVNVKRGFIPSDYF
jgi:hypothetical protein